jgi:hypothetical protein
MKTSHTTINGNSHEVKFENEASNDTLILLYSYTTLVAVYLNGYYYVTDTYHSKTTSTHINRFIEDNFATKTNLETLLKDKGFVLNMKGCLPLLPV